MTITSFLAIFLLLLISSALYFAAKRARVPYTVLLVLAGMVISPIAELPYLQSSVGFLNDVTLTPELLFYVFLPMLIFESAFNINVRRMVENAWHIGVLSVLGLFISSAIIAVALYGLLGLVGAPIPFIVALLFGAIISATDPVAVLALFKEFGAPKRLSLIFEGESLFNDGTAVALFAVVLGIAQSGFAGASTVFDGVVLFVEMMVLGVLFGIGMATLFSRALRYTRSNEFVSITMLLVSAHLVFILSEFINEHGIFGVEIHISAIIATSVAALFLGNYARHIMSPASDEYLGKSIEHLAFVANSLVFLLAGILFSSVQVDLGALGVPILVTVLVVAVARAISVYSITLPLNSLRPDLALSRPWQLLLAWGSLRGALAIIVVLLIPPSFTVEGWVLPYSVRDFLLALTIGCILATLFIKATTIGWLMRRLGIIGASPLRKARSVELGLDYLASETLRLQNQMKNDYLPKESLQRLKLQLEEKIAATLAHRDELLATHGHALFVRALHYTALSIEQHYLQELYANGEVSEPVYRKILGKLNLQREKIEYAQHESINPSTYTDKKDIFDRLVLFVTSAVSSRSKGADIAERHQYYRAQAIIARKVLKTLEETRSPHTTEIFDAESYAKVCAIYVKHHETAAAKEHAILDKHAEALVPYIEKMSLLSLRSSGNKALRFFVRKGMADQELAEEIAGEYSFVPRD